MRDCASQWKALAKSSAVKRAATRIVSSSRKVVRARQVSVMAYRAFSCSSSTSASRRRPKNVFFATCPSATIATNARLAMTTMDSLLVARYTTVG